MSTKINVINGVVMEGCTFTDCTFTSHISTEGSTGKHGRIIKFRGKDVFSGKMVYGDLVHNQKVTRYGCVPRVMVGGYEVNPDTIGQFTGLYDTNGKEIYEGDIIRFYLCGDKYIVYVGFNNEVGAWCVIFKGSGHVGTTPLGKMLGEYDGMEVIGNIHNNPELIKEK